MAFQATQPVPPDRRTERGSVLLLVPAAVLVLFVLGAIAVDAAVVFLAQRELGSATAAAANDAAAAAFAEAPFYERGRVELDLARARYVAAESLAARASTGLALIGEPDVRIVGRQICVTAEARVPRIFGGAIPGAADPPIVRAQSSATLAGQGDPQPGPVAC